MSKGCVEIFVKLTPEERNALKPIATGQVGTVSIAQLGSLKSFNLIHHNGVGISLTGKAREIADFC